MQARSPSPGAARQVHMMPAEALRLHSALHRSRVRLAAEILRVGRSRSMTPPEQRDAVSALRADLGALEEFSKLLCDAHGLGGA